MEVSQSRFFADRESEPKWIRLLESILTSSYLSLNSSYCSYQNTSNNDLGILRTMHPVIIQHQTIVVLFSSCGNIKLNQYVHLSSLVACWLLQYFKQFLVLSCWLLLEIWIHFTVISAFSSIENEPSLVYPSVRVLKMVLNIVGLGDIAIITSLLFTAQCKSETYF